MLSAKSIDAVITFRNSQGETVRGVLTTHQRRSLVMEVYNPYSIVQVSEVLSELTVRSGERAVYRGKAVVVSLLNTGLMAVVSVSLIDEWDELAVMGHDPASYAEQAEGFVQEWNNRFTIAQDYQVTVSELRAYLSDVSRWVDQADMAPTLPKDSEGRLRKDVFFEIAEPLMSRARGYFDNFEGVAEHVEPDLLPVHRAFAQTAIHPLILRAPFVYRTFAKPLGYAGDYMMVNQMLADPRDGASTYFQIINTLFLHAAVAQAHRNRIDVLVGKLAELVQLASAADGQAPLRVLNVGCGPAVEIQRLIAEHPTPGKLAFTLMDFSRETLAYTKARIDEACAQRGVQVPVTLLHESVHNLLKRASGDRGDRGERANGDGAGSVPPFDFVYCAGLFDYLSDKVCMRLLQYFAARTRVDGSILVTNVHSANPQRNVMEHLLEWHLIYRDEADMRRLVPALTRVDELFTDSTGVNVFLTLTVQAQTG